MSTSTLSRKGSITRLIPVVVAAAAMSCAARDHTSPTTAAAAAANAQHDAPTVQACLEHAPAQVLSLKSAKNIPFQLAYFRGCGWRYVADPSHIDSDTSQSQQASGYATSVVKMGLPVNEPLTVFIDGPTGYTFVWVRDAGWKFVGQMAGESLSASYLSAPKGP